MEGKTGPLIERVRERIKETELDIRDAAAAIGVTEDSLSRHLCGAYVRSDSAAKYRIWLDGLNAKTRRLDLLPNSARGKPLSSCQPGRRY